MIVGKISERGDELNSEKSLNVININKQPNVSKKCDSNRYGLRFFIESEQELKEKKEDARKIIDLLPEIALEVESEDVFSSNDLDMPKRPAWDYKMSPGELELNEEKYFREYLSAIQHMHSVESVSYFDLNLETWRQLWRVLEMSDIVLLIADIRHPIFHFPPSLYNYVTNELDRSMILILNKVDLVSASVVLAWQRYFRERYPQLHVVPFASYAGLKKKSEKSKKRIGKLRMAAKGARSLLTVCQQIVGTNVDLTSWKDKIEEELREEETSLAAGHDEDDVREDNPLAKCHVTLGQDLNSSHYKFEKYKDGVLTIGCVGHPNVGKSSLLNALMGKKVVSVSRTPGHTKHFQTIFLTPNLRLCDCPGLVFPSRTPKPLQVLMGCFPIAQLREPYSSIAYLAQRVDLFNILKMQKDFNQWTAFDICEKWAIKRKFFTARTARPDVYRAANNILRMALDGRTICLCFYPKNYLSEKHYWENHQDIKNIQSIQGEKLGESHEDFQISSEASKSSEDEEDESYETFKFTGKGKFSVLNQVESD